MRAQGGGGQDDRTSDMPQLYLLSWLNYMTFDIFTSCLVMLFEYVMILLIGVVVVVFFPSEEGVILWMGPNLEALVAFTPRFEVVVGGGGVCGPNHENYVGGTTFSISVD